MARDLSELPKAKPKAIAGWAPDPEPRFAAAIIAELNRINPPDKPTAMGTPMRVSDAGKCSRRLGYQLMGIPAEPMDDSGTVAVGTGTMLHDAWQAGMSAEYGPAVQHEVKCSPIPGILSGHADSVVSNQPTVINPDADGHPRTCVELKSQGGYGFKNSSGTAGRGAAKGPSFDHVQQGAMCAISPEVDADEVTIVYIAKDHVSVQQAAKHGFAQWQRWSAEWTLPREEFEPIARREIARFQAIYDLHADGQLARRMFPNPELPGGAEIVDPLSGTWEVAKDGNIIDTGSWWACAYCDYQDLCSRTNSGRITTDEVAVAIDGYGS